MPWRQNPKNPKEVQKNVSGRWVHHANAKSATSAKKMIRLLYGVKHGMKLRKK